MSREFVYTLANGLDVNVEYSIDIEGCITLGAITPLGMPQALAAVEYQELDMIAGAAHADAWGELDVTDD